jgi:hypothetical protein
MNKQRKRHNPEQIVRKLRDADAMLNAAKIWHPSYRSWKSVNRLICVGGISTAV